MLVSQLQHGSVSTVGHAGRNASINRLGSSLTLSSLARPRTPSQSRFVLGSSWPRRLWRIAEASMSLRGAAQRAKRRMAGDASNNASRKIGRGSSNNGSNARTTQTRTLAPGRAIASASNGRAWFADSSLQARTAISRTYPHSPLLRLCASPHPARRGECRRCCGLRRLVRPLKETRLPLFRRKQRLKSVFQESFFFATDDGQ